MPKISLDFEATDNVSDVLKKISKSMETTSVSGKKAEQGISGVSKESVKSKGELTKFSESITKMSELMQNTIPGSGTAATAINRLGKATGIVSKEATGGSGAIGGLTGGLKALVNPATLAIAALAAVTLGIGKLISAGMEAWEPQTKAIQNMEGALLKAGIASETASSKLQDMAKGLQATGVFSDQDILENVTTSLLEFSYASDEAFGRTQQAAVDVVAAIKGVNASTGDMSSIAITLGKALDDPISGLASLKDIGIQFTAEERNKIIALQKSNDLMGAQDAILSKVEDRYSGMNAKLATTNAGIKALSEHQVQEALETMGAAIDPLVTKFAQIKGDVFATIGKMFEGKDDKQANEVKQLLKLNQQLQDVASGKLKLDEYSLETLRGEIKYLEHNLGMNNQINQTLQERSDYYKQFQEQNNIFSSSQKRDNAEAEKRAAEEKARQAALWTEKKKGAQDYYTNLKAQIEASKRNEQEQLTFTLDQQIEQLDKYKEEGLISQEQLLEGKKALEDKYNTDIQKIQDKANEDNRKKTIAKEIEKWEAISEVRGKAFTESSFAEVAAVGKMTQGIVDSFQGMGNNVAKIYKDMEKDAGRTSLNIKDYFSLAASGATAALTSLSSVLSMQQSMKQASYDRQLEALREMHEEETRLLDESYERLQEDQENKDELRLAELEKYELALEDKIDNEIRYALDKKKRDLTRAAEEKALEKKKAEEQKKLDQEYALAKYNIEVEAFKSQKSAEKSNVGIQTAIGVVNAWASSMLLPWPLKLAIGGMLSALMIGTGAKQMAMIDAQEPPPPPKFAGGVTNFEGGWAIVGERGPEMVTLPQGSNVITNENTQSLLAPIYITNDIYLDSVLIASQLVDARRSASYGGY